MPINFKEVWKNNTIETNLSVDLINFFFCNEEYNYLNEKDMDFECLFPLV